MTVLLNVQSSPNLPSSASRQVSRAYVDGLLRYDAATQVTDLDLARHPLPHLDENHLGAFFAPPEAQSAASAAALKVSDGLVDQLLATDVLVLGTPMHNFGIASTLKSWIDNICRLGKTFRYTETGSVVGLLPPMRVVIVVSSGGVYSEGPMRPLDFASTYLAGVFGFLGATDISVIHVEGMNMGPEMAERGMAAALARAETLAARPA